MTKLFLTMTLALFTTLASAQYSVMTTVIEIEGEYNVTDKIGVGYQINDCSMVGVTMDGEDKYKLLARHAVLAPRLWATCIYNYDAKSDGELIDNVELGMGYSFKVWDSLYIDPNYTMPVKADAAGEREGKLNLSVSYTF